MVPISTRKTALALGPIAIVVLSIFVGPASAHAENGCPDKLVPRNARPGDVVCVSPRVAARVAAENANPDNNREPNGGAYGPLTCKPGYVWREAFDGDAICVTPERRQQTWDQNANAPRASESQTPPGPPPPVPPAPQAPGAPIPTPPPVPPAQGPGAPIPTPAPNPNICDPRVDICIH